MSNLTKDTPVVMRGLVRKTNPYVITDGVQLYVGGICELSGGYCTAYASTGGATRPPLGIAEQGGIPGSNPVLDGFVLTSLPIPMIGKGNASSAAAGNANKVVVETGEVTLENVTITVQGTLAGTQADVGTKVYAVTSNPADLTPTQPGTDVAFGEIQAFKSLSGSLGTYDILKYNYRQS